jgi:thiamine-phosphate pyrophosphorylase
MADQEKPQLYLITPVNPDLSLFSNTLIAVLDDVEVACLRLSTAGMDEEAVRRAADTMREITHARDIPLVIEDHAKLVTGLGLDGVHLGDGSRRVRATRDDLGSDAIIGAYCGTHRHDGISAAEAGADYVSFGPVGASDLGDGSQAEPDLFSWWSEMIEIPIVAEGNLNEDLLASISQITDFIAIGPEIWGRDDPAKHLKTLLSTL